MRIVLALSLGSENGNSAMLKRIKSIQNVGRFKNCKPANIEFGPITFIYGLNTYGKSTLGDVFSSLRTFDAASIKARKTIPSDSTPQEIELSFLAEGKQETTVKYSHGEWSKNFPIELSLHVFDDGFYHKNLFSSRQFTRATKEAFSSFILGEQGVVKTELITSKNKLKAEVTRELGKLKTNVFNDISDLPSFLTLASIESKETLEDKVGLLRTDYDSLKKQRSNIQKITNRKTLIATNWTKEFSQGLKLMNSTLRESMKVHQEAAREAVAKHISKNFKGDRGAEAWIRQGLYYRKGDECQFCGQYMSLDALDLINIYEQSFDTSFENNSTRIIKALESAHAAISKPYITQLTSILERNKEPLASYPELDESAYFTKLRQLVADIEGEISEAIPEWNAQWSGFVDSLNLSVMKKKETPNLDLPELRDFGLTQIEANLTTLCYRYDQLIEQTNTAILEFKATINVTDLDKKMEQIAEEGKTLNSIILRIKLDPQCNEFVKLSQKSEALTKEIPTLNNELRKEQSDFLDRYFLKINEYFEKFGSEDFELCKGEDGKGHTPVYFLKVKYHGHDVSEKNLEQVFSESDRRALALSVFWAGVMESEPDKRANTIVILDDPITSFDCNRMTSAHMEIVELSKKVRQVLILSHFEHGVAAFLSIYRNQLQVRLISISKNDQTSNLTLPDVDSFIATEHEKRRSKIFSFISSETDVHNAADLRVFFEIEISHRFAQQIASKDISEVNLSDRIDKLQACSIISEEVAKAAHDFRILLNPVHHVWQSNNIEDQRNVAKKLIAFIYSELLPTAIQ